jgi:hypothetical protein
MGGAALTRRTIRRHILQVNWWASISARIHRVAWVGMLVGILALLLSTIGAVATVVLGDGGSPEAMAIWMFAAFSSAGLLIVSYELAWWSSL